MAALEEVAKQTLRRKWVQLVRSFVSGEASLGEQRRGYLVFAVFVFLILAALYESWSLPFSVLLTIPIAIFGAFPRTLAAWLRP